MAGMAIIGFVGGVYRKTLRNNGKLSLVHIVELPILAGSLTLLYDVITNAGFALIANLDLIVVLIIGAWFTVIHVAWNTFLFTAAFIPLVEAVKKVWRGEEELW